uniref:Uncharacterized protein n=1 Tax=Rhizophora mucronata TaxID=61149 RepID=A0A2P2K030_RHIMU
MRLLWLINLKASFLCGCLVILPVLRPCINLVILPYQESVKSYVPMKSSLFPNAYFLLSELSSFDR